MYVCSFEVDQHTNAYTGIYVDKHQDRHMVVCQWPKQMRGHTSVRIIHVTNPVAVFNLP